MAKHAITRRNTGETIRVRVIQTDIDIRRQPTLSRRQKRLMQIRSRMAKMTAIRAVARVGEDHLGGALGIIDPLEMTLSVMDRKKGDDFFIAHGHVAAGYYGVLSSHGYLSREDVIDGFRTERPIGGHVTPVAGGTLNTGRLGDEAAGVGMALALAALGKPGIIYLHTSDGSANEGSFMEALELAAKHRLRVIFICDVNGLQLSGTTKHIHPSSDPAAKALAAGVKLVHVSTLHHPGTYYRALHRAVRWVQGGKGPVFVNPTGYALAAGRVFPEQGHRGFQPSQKIWIPGSLMGCGITAWERNIIETLNKERLGMPMSKPANYHDGNTKGMDVDAVLSALSLSLAEEQAWQAQWKNTTLHTYRARPKAAEETGYSPGRIDFFPASATYELNGIRPPSDWVSPRKGVFRALAAIGKHNRRRMLAVGLDLEGSTQIKALFDTLGPGRAFQAGIQERGGILAAAGASHKLLKESGGGKIPTVSTGTFASFLFSTGQEGLDFINYQEDIHGLVSALPVKIVCSHTGMNPGKDGLTAQYLHAVDAAYNLIRLKRAFIPADANHAIHIMRELYRLADFAMYIGPRGETPLFRKANTRHPFYGPTYRFQAVDRLRKGDGKIAFLVTGPVLYRAFCAADILRREKQIQPSIHYIGRIKPFPAAKILSIAASHKAVLTIEDGYVGGSSEPARGLAGLVAGTLAHASGKKLRGLPRLGRIGNTRGETMSQSPEVIYDRYGLSIRGDIVRQALRLLRHSAGIRP